MKLNQLFLGVFIASSIMACEDSVNIDLGETEPAIVIDAWVDNRPSVQTINITRSRDFNDVGDYDRLTADAVFIQDLTDTSQPNYVFTETTQGVFEWTPPSALDSFGIVGHTYRLNVVIGSSEFQAVSVLNPVPTIDSIKFNYESENNFQKEGFEAEFFSTDLEGQGNTYWIKPFKNGIFLDQPEYIATSYDGSFSESDQDGILFIPPIRSAINTFEDGDDDKLDRSYAVGDSVALELHGITGEAFLYLNEIRTQTDRQGGISELFAVPMTNLTGNVEVVAGEEKVLGFFSTSSVEISGLLLTPELAEEAREEEN